SKAEIGVRREARRKFFSERGLPLIADDAVAGAFFPVAGRQNQAEARRECRHAVGFFQQLIAIVDEHIAGSPDALALLTLRERWNRKRKLVLKAVERPFLREAERPAAVLRVVHINRVKDVLNDARVLIVRLLDEKTVVLDPVDRRLLRRRLRRV